MVSEKQERGLQNLEEYNKNEIAQMLVIASYAVEIERRKLAAQLVLTLGEECSDEKILRILTEDCQHVIIRQEQLDSENVECGAFYVLQQKGRILVVVRNKSGEKAEVYADYGSADGMLAIGRESYQTMEGTVFELDVDMADELQVIVYTYPVEYEEEKIKQKEYN